MNHPIFGPAQAGLQWLSDRVWKVEHAFERANAQRQHTQGGAARITLLLVLLGVGFTLVAGFAVRAALVEVSTPSRNAALLTGARAPLVDRNGSLLAADVYIYDLFVDSSDMTSDDRLRVRRSLEKLYPNVSKQAFDRAFSGGRPTLLMQRMTESERARLLSYGLPGVSFDARRVRGYPLAETAAHYIGMAQLDHGGVSGAEYAFDGDIRANASSDSPVMLALDLRVQGALEHEMRVMAEDQHPEGAFGLVTNVRTGEVIAMASYPDFDLNQYGTASDLRKKNVGANNVYEVGSIFKVITLAVALDTGTATTASTYDVTQPFTIGRRRITDFRGANRVITLEEVFTHSSNIGTSQIISAVGIDKATQYYKSLGLFRRADIELREAANPLLPPKWSLDSLASTSFGHGMNITALSYAEAVGAALNGGWLRPLTLRKYQPGQPLRGQRVFSVNTSRTMLDFMRQNAIKGSGKRANVTGLRVGGKTGSAHKPQNGRYGQTDLVASFAAVFPTDGPVDGDRYLVLILFDSPKGSAQTGGIRRGGAVAAPVAANVITRIAPFVGVTRRDDVFAAPDWDTAPIIGDNETGGTQ